MEIANLDRHSLQGDKQVLRVLRQMGAKIITRERGVYIPPPLRSTPPPAAPAALRGGRFDLNDIPDALPALMVSACHAQQAVCLHNVAHARIKETDRIAVMSTELRKMGGRITEHPDGVTIHPTPLHGARLCGHSDHRVVMALSIAALAARGSSVISDAEAVAITYPTFFEELSKLMRKQVKIIP